MLYSFSKPNLMKSHTDERRLLKSEHHNFPLKYCGCGLWMTFKKTLMAKTLINGLSNYDWNEPPSTTISQILVQLEKCSALFISWRLWYFNFFHKTDFYILTYLLRVKYVVNFPEYSGKIQDTVGRRHPFQLLLNCSCFLLTGPVMSIINFFSLLYQIIESSII